MVHAAPEESCLGVAGLALSVIICRIDALDRDSVHLFDCFLYLNLVGIGIHDEAVAVQLFALSRQLLCYYRLNNNSHLLIRLALVPFCEGILHAVDEHQGVGVHDCVGVDLINGDDIDLGKVAG